LHFPVTHDDIIRQIEICNGDYKFAAYPHSILQEFVIDNEVIGTIHFERFSPETVRKLHARRTCSYKVLRMIASVALELDIPWDPGINLIFSEEDFDSFYCMCLSKFIINYS